MGVRFLPCCLLALLAVASGGAAVAGEGLVALQTADGSCPDDSGNRYVDCGNGTVTDNETGLIWLANANCFGLLNWFEAMAAVAGLSDLPDDSEACIGLTPDECDCGLSDGSSPGEWRLPSISKWEAMVDRSCTNPALSDDTGDRCWGIQCFIHPGWECSFYGVQSSFYWSSSTAVNLPTFAWGVGLGFGNVGNGDKGFNAYGWPVRGGQ